MRRPRSAPPGRIPASGESPAQKAARERGLLIRERGDLGEAAFLHKATSLGFMVARPWRNIYRYDFIVEGGQNLWRVQVKTTSYILGGLYRLGVCHRSKRGAEVYEASELDFVVAYVFPEESWYVLPVREVVGRTTLSLCPKGYPHLDRYAHYREAWHLLCQPDGLIFG
jgi:hypothetical protein